jgi:heme exporter protein C
MNRVLDALIGVLWLVVTALMPVALWLVFLHAPEEKVMGAAQRIFYFHVPSAIVTFLAVSVLLGASVAYLWTRDLRWDNLSRAATETAVVFCTIVLTTGPLWARPAWGVWWTWEAKLTTTLILWLLLVACMMVRSYAENRDAGARLAAIVGIVAAVDVPIIHKATVWWRGQHPVVFQPDQGGALAPPMLLAFQVALLAVTLLFALVLALRYRVAQAEDRVAALADHLSFHRGA